MNRDQYQRRREDGSYFKHGSLKNDLQDRASKTPAAFEMPKLSGAELAIRRQLYLKENHEAYLKEPMKIGMMEGFPEIPNGTIDQITIRTKCTL